ncbi:unnamed protein product, partial [Laminaria digitata]
SGGEHGYSYDGVSGVSGGGGGSGRGDRFVGSLLRQLCFDAVTVGQHSLFGLNVGLRLSIIRFVFYACQVYGAGATRPLFGNDEVRGRDGGGGGG